MSTAPLKTPLYDRLVSAHARFTEFAGWAMPLQFSGLRQEHQAVRTQAGLFDISHMAKFQVQGAAVIAALQSLVPTDLSGLSPGQAQYTVLLNDQGGIVDDLIIYVQSQAQCFIIANAATHDSDRAWLEAHLPGCELVDWTRDRALLAVQGPDAATALTQVVQTDVAVLPSFGHQEVAWAGESLWIARTGYTGEDGFEVMVSPDLAPVLWAQLCEGGVLPCGLGARDTLRLEAALALYGQDLDTTTTPLEGGLGWLVHLDRGLDFIGRSVLTTQKRDGVTRRLVGLQMQDRHIARSGYPLLVHGETVGRVTSGTQSPTLGAAIALAYLPPAYSQVGQKVEVLIRGQTYPAIVVKKPFYRSPHRCQTSRKK